MVTYRWATADDAPAGARVHLTCWRETYADLVDRDLLEARISDPAPWEDAWREQLVHGPPRMLALDGEEIVGFAVAGPRRLDSTDPDHLPDDELYALYVRRSWWGTGVGQTLLDAVLDGRPACLWVLEENARARAFYLRNGFRPDGARDHLGWLDAWEVRLVR